MSKKQKLIINETAVATIYIKLPDDSVKEILELVEPNSKLECLNNGWYTDYPTIYPERSIQKISLISYDYKEPVISEVTKRKASEYNDNKPSYMKIF